MATKPGMFEKGAAQIVKSNKGFMDNGSGKCKKCGKTKAACKC